MVIAGVRRAFVKNHCGIAAEYCLNFHCDLRRNEGSTSIKVILKVNAFVRDLSQLREGKNLVPTAISQNRSIPVHEFMQAAEMLDHVDARSDKQMISIPENDLSIEFTQFSRSHSFHRSLPPDGHERRRIDCAMQSQ